MLNKDIILKELKLQLNNKIVVVGVSTGLDSMVLLNLLEHINCKIIVAHVNHHKREQSTLEQEYIKSYCMKKGIICEVKELFFESSQNFQEEARLKRYEFFYDLYHKYNASYLLTAHHANDDLETILMRLIRGSSLKGYAGMDVCSQYKDINIYRPLLNIQRKDILEYAESNNIKYFDDSSNDEDDYLRNRIRHNIIPIIESENPNIYETIQDFKENINNCNELVFNIIHDFEKEKVSYLDNITSFDINDFNKYNNYLKVQILFDLLKPIKPSRDLIDELIKQIENDKSLIINEIEENFFMIKEYGMIKFGKIFNHQDFYLKIDKEGIYILDDLSQLEVVKNKCNFRDKEIDLCYNINNLPIVIRTRQNGDKIKIHNKLISLSDYLTNKKITHFKRNNLVVCNDINEVLFVLGLEVK